LPASQKYTFRPSYAPTVYIELGTKTPGVGKYNANPVMKKSPSMKMQTARKISSFVSKEKQEVPGPGRYKINDPKVIQAKKAGA